MKIHFVTKEATPGVLKGRTLFFVDIVLFVGPKTLMCPTSCEVCLEQDQGWILCHLHANSPEWIILWLRPQKVPRITTFIEFPFHFYIPIRIFLKCTKVGNVDINGLHRGKRNYKKELNKKVVSGGGRTADIFHSSLMLSYLSYLGKC